MYKNRKIVDPRGFVLRRQKTISIIHTVYVLNTVIVKLWHNSIREHNEDIKKSKGVRHVSICDDLRSAIC